MASAVAVPARLQTDGAVDDVLRDREIEHHGDHRRDEPCQEPDPQPLSRRKRLARL